MTKQKQAVLDAVRSDKCHHTADEILELSRLSLPSISRATVYNNLRVLEEEGLIRRIGMEGGADRYDGSYIPHGHTVCEMCGAVRDFEPRGIEGLLLGSVGAEYSSYELKVRVLCPNCKRCASNE